MENSIIQMMEKIGVEKYSFEGIDNDIVSEIMRGIEVIYSKYPCIFQKVNAIGGEDFIQNLLFGSNGKEMFRSLISRLPDPTMACITSRERPSFFRKKGALNYCSIVIRNDILNSKDQENFLFTPFSMTIHEFGHVLDEVVGLSDDEKLKKELLKIDSRFSEEYKTGKINELIAVFFQFYIAGKNQQISNIIGARIEEKYEEYSQENIIKNKTH